MKTRLYPVCYLLLVALCLMAQGCGTNQLNIAAKSILTAQEAYDATLSASAQAYKDGFLSDESKEKIIAVGAIAHDSIQLAQTSLLVALDASTKENMSKLDAAIAALRENVSMLIGQAVALGVKIYGAAVTYKGE